MNAAPLTAAERDSLRTYVEGEDVRAIGHSRGFLASWIRRLLAERDALAAELAEAQGHARDHHLEACITCMAMEAETDEARGIARRLREMAHPVDQDDGEVLAAFDALHWPDPTPEE